MLKKRLSPIVNTLIICVSTQRLMTIHKKIHPPEKNKRPCFRKFLCKTHGNSAAHSPPKRDMCFPKTIYNDPRGPPCISSQKKIQKMKTQQNSLKLLMVQKSQTTTWVGAKHPNHGISTTFTSTGDLFPDFWLPSNKSTLPETNMAHENPPF